MRSLAVIAVCIILMPGVAAADSDTMNNAPPANTPAPPQPGTIPIPHTGDPNGAHGSIITNTTQPPSPTNPRGETGGAAGVTIPFNKK
jgi:hypothetical protein